MRDYWVTVENAHAQQRWTLLADEWRPMTYEEVVAYCGSPTPQDPTPEEVDQRKWEIQINWQPHTKFDRRKEARLRLQRLGKALKEAYRCDGE